MVLLWLFQGLARADMVEWTSWVCENRMFHYFCVFNGISTLSFSVLKRRLHAVANHRSVNVRSMVLSLWYSISISDFPSNHGNDHLGKHFPQRLVLLFAVWLRLVLSEALWAPFLLQPGYFLKVVLKMFKWRFSKVDFVSGIREDSWAALRFGLASISDVGLRY